MVCGALSIVLAILGAFLPVLPTTPFLLLAAACFARASERFYNRLLNDRYVGRYIRDWRRTRAIPLPGKIMGISMVVLSLSYTILFHLSGPIARISTGALGCIGIVIMLRIPIRRD